MSNKLAVSAEEVRQRLLDGETLHDIATSLEVSMYSVRQSLSRAGIKARGLKKTVQQRVEECIDRWVANKVQLSDAASELGITTSHLSNTLRQAGLSLNGKPRATSRALKEKTDAVLAVLMTEGGTLLPICQQLGYEGSLKDIQYEIRKRGIDTRDYFYAFRRYNDWQILPGEVIANGASDRTLPARCLKCGTTHRVNYSNVVSGQSRCCMACKSSDPKQVVDVVTGEVFPSIRAALVTVDRLDEYQKALYHLKNQGQYSVEGLTLELRKED